MKIDPDATGRDRVRYVDIGLLDGPDGHLGAAPEVRSAEAPSRCRQVIAAGDTLYSTVRPYLRKIALVSEELKGEFASTGYAVLRPTAEIHPAYLYYFTLSRHFEDQILPMQKGVSYPAVLDREVRAQRVWFPDRGTQQRIVEILEDHLSHLDAAASSLGMARVRADALRISSAAAEVSFAGDAPVAALSSHALAVEYGTSVKAHVDARPGDVPVLRMGNVKNGQLDWSSLKYVAADTPDLPKLLLRPGDLLFNRTNSAEHVGKSAVFEGDAPVTFASYLIRVRFDDRILPDWANLVINSPYGRRYIAGVVSQQVGQANVNGTKLKAFPLVLPELDAQRKGVRRYAAVVGAARRLAREAELVAYRAESLRRATLTAAFEGKLTGRHTDQELIEEVAAR